MVVISGVISLLICVIIIVLLTPLITTHEPPSIVVPCKVLLRSGPKPILFKGSFPGL